MTLAVLRCDATPDGGVGHLVRAVSVADAARDAGHEVVVAGAIRSELAQQLLADAGIEAVPAGDDLGILAAEVGATVVHVDDYAVGPDAIEQVHASGALLSSMEDSSFGRRPADIAVDSTIGAERTQRPRDGSGAVLRGIRYAPMRAAVRAARAQREASRPVGPAASILVVMGGTDATGAAGTIAAVCTAARGAGDVTVIARASAWDDVRAAAGDEVRLEEPSPAFLDRARDADLVVSAAGTTAWELACIGVPSLLVAVVANQVAGYEAALSTGIAHGLGTLDEVRADPAAATARVEEALRDLREGRSWAAAGRDAVDGLGASRIVAAWGDALDSRHGGDGSSITARPAGESDALLLLRWRNDPATRRVSRSTGLVPWGDHAGWFRAVLASEDRELYVVEQAGAPIGTVRFDRLEEPEWEVSITLAPEARGRGLAGPVLAAGERAFDGRHPGTRIVAAVLPGNEASQRLFRRAGYELAVGRRDGDFDVLVRRDPS